MVKHTQTIHRLLADEMFETNCLSVFDQFVGLTLQRLTGLTFLPNKSTLTFPGDSISIPESTLSLTHGLMATELPIPRPQEENKACQ